MADLNMAPAGDILSIVDVGPHHDESSLTTVLNRTNHGPIRNVAELHQFQAATADGF